MLTFDLRQDLEEGPDGGLDRPTHYRPPDRIGLRVAWILHREALMELYEQVVADDHRRICRRPWAWWQFEAPEQPRAGERKIACLRRLGLLRLDEEAYLAADHERATRSKNCECAACLPVDLTAYSGSILVRA